MDELEKKGLTWAAYSEQNDPFESTLGGWVARYAPLLVTRSTSSRRL